MPPELLAAPTGADAPSRRWPLETSEEVPSLGVRPDPWGVD